MSVKSERHWSNKAHETITAATFVLFLATGYFLTSQVLSAQNRNAGEIRGTVTDQTGAEMPGVTVTITEISTGVTQHVTTNGAGIYDAPDVLPGQYTLKFSKEGFKELIRSGIVLYLQTITVDAHLQVGSLSQRVNVTAPAPLVQTETSEKSMTLTSVPVEEIPDVGRSWMNLTGLLPGVNGGGTSGTVAGGNASGESVGANGTGAYQANWLIDGARAMYAVSNNPGGLIMPIESIAEVKMTVSNFSAEYGGGVQVYSVITKSGTNHWHGSLYESVQNDKLEARDFFAPSVLPLRWNDYGGTVGGPIKRDKAFFFFSLDRADQKTLLATLATVPTLAMRNGDFSAPGLPTIYDPNTTTLVNGQYVRQPVPGNVIPSSEIDPVAGNIQQYFPNPNLPGIYNNYYAELPNSPQKWFFYSGKVDYNISSSNRLSGSGVYNPGHQWIYNVNTVGDMIDFSAPFENVHAQITDAWTLSPNLVNEFRMGFLRSAGWGSSSSMGKGYPQKIGLINAAANAFPNINIGGTVTTSLNGGTHAGGAENNFTPSDMLTWIKGKHMLKVGGEFDRWQSAEVWGDVDAGDFSFSGIFTRNPVDPTSAGLGYADFLFGLPQDWGVSMSPEYGGRSWNMQLFVQDDYKVTPKLTLNLGVRYQIQAGWREAFNRVVSFDPALMNPATNTLGAVWYGGQHGRTALEKTIPDVFSPRLGFAWAPAPNWSIRGGYGIFPMARNGDTYTSGIASGWGWSGYETSTDLITPIFRLSQGLPSATFYPLPSGLTPDSLNGQPVSYVPYDTPMSYTQAVHFDIQRRIRGDIVVDTGYVFTRGVHLGFGRDINQVPPNLLGPGDAQLKRPYPQFQGISAALFDGFSNYHAFQLSVRKQFSQGLMFLVNYTASKDMDTGMGSGWGGAENIDNWQNAYDPRANYGLSTIDLPQTLNGAFIYQLPFGAGKRFVKQGGVLGAMVGGWQVSSMFQLHSGSPFTPIVGTANLSGSLAGSWYPNRIANGRLAKPTINTWFDTSAFVTPDPYTFGNSGRGVLRGPDYRDLDFSLAKDFPIRRLGEAGRLQIRADVFNLFNHPNFGQPNNAIGTPGAGVVSSTVGSGFASSGSTGRNIQLGAKITF
jgi:outer membrane receptor protein involved in Fe transport